MRITPDCKSAVTISKLAMVFDISSLFDEFDELSAKSLFLTSTNSPTIFIISSRVLVSTLTVVSCFFGVAITCGCFIAAVTNVGC